MSLRLRERWAALGLLTLSCTAADPDADEILPASPGPSCSAGAETCSVVLEEGPDPGRVVSCCDSIWVPGGTFPMGFSAAEFEGDAEAASQARDHDVRVRGFFLDRFEITIARFSAYAAQYSEYPAAEAGAHPVIGGSGWQAEWNEHLPPPGQMLRSGSEASAVSSAPEAQHLPAGGLSWFEAFAFCIWDGGRLPTEAEWEYAAAGGRLDRPYPWGSDRSVADALRSAPLESIGASAATRGFFGHDDLAGGVHEWVLDWYDEDFYLEVGGACSDCANLRDGIGRVIKGGADAAYASNVNTEFRAAARYLAAPGMRLAAVGARCARDPTAPDSSLP